MWPQQTVYSTLVECDSPILSQMKGETVSKMGSALCYLVPQRMNICKWSKVIHSPHTHLLACELKIRFLEATEEKKVFQLFYK